MIQREIVLEVAVWAVVIMSIALAFVDLVYLVLWL